MSRKYTKPERRVFAAILISPLVITLGYFLFQDPVVLGILLLAVSAGIGVDQLLKSLR